MTSPRGSVARFAGALAALAAACGPNYRYVYEGEAAFERCYAQDFDQDASPADRTACWQTWIANYNYGAGTDRVEYARARVNSPATLPGTGGRPSLSTPGNLTADTATANPTPPPSPLAGAPGPVGSPSATAALLAATAQPPPPDVPTRVAAHGVTAVRPTVHPTTDRGIAPDARQGGRISAGGNPIAAPPVSVPAATTMTLSPPGQTCASDCTTTWSTCSGQCARNNPACAARCDEPFRDCMRGCY